MIYDFTKLKQRFEYNGDILVDDNYIHKYINFYLDRIPASQWNYMQAEKRHEGRPDLLAKSIFGASYPDMWELVCIINNIEDPFNDIKVGQSIRYLSIGDLFTLYNKLKKHVSIK